MFPGLIYWGLSLLCCPRAIPGLAQSGPGKGFSDFDERFIVASLEMLPDRNLVRTARQVAHKFMPEVSEIDSCLDWCGEAIQFYDYVGRADVPVMLENFAMGVETLGTTSIIIDSLMKMGMDEDAYSQQKRFVEDMANFAMQYNVHVHIVAHSRKNKDENVIPGKMDVMGAGGITNICDNGFTVYRNKEKEKKIQECQISGYMPASDIMNQYDCLFECWKSRDMGSDAEKSYALYYHNQSMQYLENSSDSPRSFDISVPF